MVARGFPLSCASRRSMDGGGRLYPCVEALCRKDSSAMKRLATFWRRKSLVLLLMLVGSALLDGCKRESNREPPIGSAVPPLPPTASASATSPTKSVRSVSAARAKVEPTVLVNL